MIAKLKNNNRGGGDLQFSIATFIFVFVVCVGLLFDFWFVSSAKIAVLKAVEQAELYCLVSEAKKNILDASADYENLWEVDLSAAQSAALACANVEVPAKIQNLPYIEEYNIRQIMGNTNTVGQMSITTQMTYRVKTMIKQNTQMFTALVDDDFELDSVKDIPLTVSAKLIPIVKDLTVFS